MIQKEDVNVSEIPWRSFSVLRPSYSKMSMYAYSFISERWPRHCGPTQVLGLSRLWGHKHNHYDHAYNRHEFVFAASLNLQKKQIITLSLRFARFACSWRRYFWSTHLKTRLKLENENNFKISTVIRNWRIYLISSVFNYECNFKVKHCLCERRSLASQKFRSKHRPTIGLGT